MSMHKSLVDIVHVFRNDEELLRLLHYKPEDIAKNIPDPLDPTLPNILDIDEDWSIRDKVLYLVPKSSDLEKEPICRIYLYAGRRERTSNNYMFANQEIIVDIVSHMNFEKDLRSTRVSDRVNELLVNENITGVGKVLYEMGVPIGVPVDYVGFRHHYKIGNSAK